MNARNYKINSFIILVVCVAIAGYLFKTAEDMESLNDSKYFDSKASLHLSAFKAKLHAVEDLLNDLQAFYGASNYVDRSEFDDFLRLLSEYTEKVHFIGWIPKVTAERYEKLFDEIQKDGFKGFAWGNKSMGDTPFYPLYFGYPRAEEWDKLYGKIFSDNKKINELFEANADKIGKQFVLPNVSVPDQGASFWAFTPIYKEGRLKPENHLGFVTTLFSIEKLVSKLNIDPKMREEISFHILEKQDGEMVPLYTENLEILKQASSHPNKQISISWANTDWVLCVLPSQAFATGHAHWQAWAILLIALLLSFAIARYTFLSGRRAEEISEGNEKLQNEIEEHKKARSKADLLTENLTNLAARHKLFAEALKGTINGLIISDMNKEGNPIIYANPAFQKITGYNQLEVLGANWEILLGKNPDEEIFSQIQDCIKANKDIRIDIPCYRKDGSLFYCEFTTYPVFDDKTSKAKNYVTFFEDITERKQLEEERLELERKSSQTRKLESLGTLAAGIAHEINTPVQYVNDNVDFLSKSTESIMNVLTQIHEKIKTNQPLKEVEEILDKTDYDFLKAEVPESIEAAHDGIIRVKEIVRAVKDFSRPPTTNKTREDINKAIEGALVVARHHWKDKCAIVKDLEADIPPVLCQLGEINQVLLNLIVNAVDATSENEASKPPEIRISTRSTGDDVAIYFEDNGPGIPEEIVMKIFDPFFTTKESGKGTGQGLAISKMIIEKNHGGRLELDRSKENTCFIITLPAI